jgi:hypothetical protein
VSRFPTLRESPFPTLRESPFPTLRVSLVSALLVSLTVVAGCAGSGDDDGPRFSLLAVGATGAPESDADRYETQLDVAAALEEEDRKWPVDALLLLGSNFLDEGLAESELVARVATNIVRPYCRFLSLTGVRSKEVAKSCRLHPIDRHPVPVVALRGEHDLQAPESRRLQIGALPEFVRNWRMSGALAIAYELGPGLSVIALDSAPVFEGAEPIGLVDALKNSNGPWRILAAHHPLPIVEGGEGSQRQRAYREKILDAIERSGAKVQVVLSAHSRNLQLFTPEPPAHGLQVISGSGSGAAPIEAETPRRRLGASEPGFARVDLVGEGSQSQLVVTLRTLPKRFGSSVVGRVAVAMDGTVATAPEEDSP